MRNNNRYEPCAEAHCVWQTSAVGAVQLDLQSLYGRCACITPYTVRSHLYIYASIITQIPFSRYFKISLPFTRLSIIHQSYNTPTMPIEKSDYLSDVWKDGIFSK